MKRIFYAIVLSLSILLLFASCNNESKKPGQEPTISTTPTQEATTPTQEAMTPAQEATTPAQEATTPAQEATTPAYVPTTPAYVPTTPAQVPNHTCVFSNEIVSDDFLYAAAKCNSPALYYLSCTCGKHGTDTFSSGTASSHVFSSSDVCKFCGERKATEGLLFKLDIYTNEYSVTGIETIFADIVIPSYYNGLPVTEIRYNAFQNNKQIKSVVLGQNIRVIGSNAFEGCTSLEKIEFPSGLTEVHASAFNDCKASLFKTYNNAKYLGDENNPYLILFGTISKSLTSCSVHPNTAVIVDYAFSDCTKLKSISLGDNIAGIGDYAFKNCSSLKTITIPDKVAILDNTFDGCYSMESIYLGTGLKEIEGLDCIYYTSEGEYFNNNNKRLLNVHIKDIASWASVVRHDLATINLYLNDTLIRELVIPEGVTHIAKAFENIPHIVSVTLPSTLQVIEERAFWGNDRLIEVQNKSDLSLDYKWLIGYSHDDPEADFLYIFHPENESSRIFKTNDGFWFYVGESNRYLIDYSGTAASVTLPDSLNGYRYIVGKYAFYMYDFIQSIVIPDTVTAIQESAFKDCRSLKTVSVGAGISRLPTCIFYNCTSLETVYLNKGIEAIYDLAFGHCDTLDIYFAGTEAEWNKIYKATSSMTRWDSWCKITMHYQSE